MSKVSEQEYAGSAAKVVGRLAIEALKRHSIWSEDDIAIKLVHIIPDEQTRIELVSRVAMAVESAVKDSLNDGMPID